MGMDVYGKQPTDKKGSYFRANVWYWAPLRNAMGRTSYDLLGDELLIDMGYNGGAGPDDQAICNQLAERLERALEDDRSVFEVQSDLVVDASGCFLTPEEARALGPDRVFSPYRFNRDVVFAWTEFLRHCGGFEVW